MTDLLSGRITLEGFKGLAAVGGFSYGDVLGAGGGWAKTILFNDRLSDMFAAFFARPDTFTLGICNGCQMVAASNPSFRGQRPGRSLSGTALNSLKRVSCRCALKSRPRFFSAEWPAAPCRS